MIRAKFIFGSGDLITGFEIKGHSGYAEEGEDIICASVSSAAYMTANTVTDVLFINPEVLEENDGLLIMKLSKTDSEKASDILRGFRLHLTELEKMYPNFIKIERGA